MCIVEVENIPEIKSRNEPLTVTSVLAECFEKRSLFRGQKRVNTFSRVPRGSNWGGDPLIIIPCGVFNLVF